MKWVLGCRQSDSESRRTVAVRGLIAGAVYSIVPALSKCENTMPSDVWCPQHRINTHPHKVWTSAAASQAKQTAARTKVAEANAPRLSLPFATALADGGAP